MISEKYKVLLELEEKLEFPFFKKEWGKTKDMPYIQLSLLEISIPYALMTAFFWINVRWYSTYSQENPFIESCVILIDNLWYNLLSCDFYARNRVEKRVHILLRRRRFPNLSGSQYISKGE